MCHNLSMSDNPLDPSHPEHKSILNQKLGDILKNNPHLQDRIVKSMNITPEQFQQLLAQTGGNQYMNMTISELFKSGFIQQSMQQSMQGIFKGRPGQLGQGQAVQMSPEQLQQMLGQSGQVVQMSPEQVQQLMNNQNVQVAGQPMQVIVQQQPQKQSFFQKLKGLFR